MAGIMDTVRWPFLKLTMFDSTTNFNFFVPKSFKTSLKHVQIILVNLTVKGVIASLQKIFKQS